jgi:hypothetical protein
MVYLRRMFDQSVGQQRAQVFIDGQYVAEWYVPEANTTLQWAERDLFLPAAFTNNKQALTIEIRPDSVAWDASSYKAMRGACVHAPDAVLS